MTMTASAPTAPAAAPAAAPTAEPAAPAEKSTATTRAAALKEKLSNEPIEVSSEPSDSPAEPTRADTPAAPAVPDPGAKAREERLARIEQVRAKERADEQERLTKQQGRARDTEFEKLRKQVADLEPLNAVFTSEESLLAEAERRGMSAEKLVQWMRTRLTDPAAVAQKQAQTVEEKLRAEMKALQDRIDKAEADRQAEAKQAETERAQAQKTTDFYAQVKQKTDTHPLTAAFQSKYGDGGLVAFANQFIAPLLPESYSLDELHDHVEELLDAVQVAGQRAAAPATPASGQSHHQPKNGAAEPTTTLGNAVVAGRETLAEETPLHQLPLAERTRRLKAKLERDPAA